MARRNLEGVEIYDSILKGGNRYGVLNQSISADLALADNAPHILVITPASALNLKLPANPQRGDFYLILNSAGSAVALTLQTSAGAALSPAVSLAQNKAATVFWTGTAWKALAGA